jgi:hypothetical protein
MSRVSNEFVVAAEDVFGPSNVFVEAKEDSTLLATVG